MKPLLSLLALTLISSAETQGTKPPETVSPTDRDSKPNWSERHAEKCQQAKAGHVDLILLGDSITEAWEKQTIYPNCFQPHHVLNLGFGGDRTQHALWRIQNGEIDGLSPKLVTIMLGTNNISRNEPAEIALGVEAVVSELRSRLPETEIAVLSVFPRDHTRTKGDRELTQALNALLPSIAEQEKVRFYDVSSHFLMPDGSINAALYGRDMLHLSNQGYETWAQFLQPILAEAGLETASQASSNADTSPASDNEVVRLWPLDKIGGEQNRLVEEYRTNKGGVRQLSVVKDPNLTIYPAPSDSPTPAVIYSPGGAYSILALPTEDQIKGWNDLGVTLFVLKYTIPKQMDLAIQDLQRAVRVVRHNASKWNVNPKQIGLFGNSAGGHLSTRLMNNYDQEFYPASDDADKLSCEPDFAVLQSSAYFNGRDFTDHLDTTYFHLNNKIAPTFLTYSKDDHKHYPGGVNYVAAMQEAGYAIEFKLYEKGGHGMGNCDWFSEASKWLKSQGIVD